MLDPKLRIALYMEDAIKGPSGKMGFGVLRYSQNPIVCVIDSQTAGQSVRELTGIDRDCPIVPTVQDAKRLGSDVLILGIAPPGGLIPATWWPVIDESVALGFSIVNGLHDLVGPRFPEMSKQPSPTGQFIWDIRIEPIGIKPGTGAAALLAGRRVLMIGTDMSVGKMTAGLEIARVARERSVPTGFVATGQIGITITGQGIPLDAIRVDFASGSVQQEVARHSSEGKELIIVEGQGSLIHPGSTANLPLLRGSCPTHLIMCHRAGQRRLLYFPEIEIPPLDRLAALYEDLGEACGTFPRPRTAGIALNTGHLDDEAAEQARREMEDEYGLPCVDTIRHGAGRLVDAILGTSQEDLPGPKWE